MERWCPTQQMLGVFLGDKSEETTFSWDYCTADGNIGISAIFSAPPQLSAATDFAHTAIQARKHASGTRCLLNVCNA
jgi:hypothetical protein